MSDQFSTYHTQGGVTNDSSEYGAGVKYWDTLSGIAAAKKAEQHDKRPISEIMVEIAKDNGLDKQLNGKDCNGKTVHGIIVPVNHDLKIRGPQITVTPHYDCPPEKLKKVPVEETPVAETPKLTEPPPPPAPPAPKRGIPLAEYPDDGSPDNGGWSPTRSAADSVSEVLNTQRRGYKLQGPDVAARLGGASLSGSVQTYGDLGKMVGLTAVEIATPIAGTVVAFGQKWGFAPVSLELNSKLPQSEVYDGRQGGDRVQGHVDQANGYGPVDVPLVGGVVGVPFNGTQSLKDTYFNPFGTSKTTTLRSTYLPGTTQYYDQKEGRIKDIPHNDYDNDLIGRVQSFGDNAPVITPSLTRQNSDYTKGNKVWVLNKAGKPEQLQGLSDFGLSAFHDSRSIDLVLQQQKDAFNAAPTVENAQAVVETYNYKTKLPTVIGNIPNPNGEVRNPLDLVLAQRGEFLDAAKAKGVDVTKLDMDAQPKDIPIRTSTREELRQEYIDYYAHHVLSGNSIVVEGGFDRVYKYYTGESVPSTSSEPKLIAAATKFVDSLPLIKTIPVDGAPLNELDNTISRRNRPITPFEQFDLEPKTRLNDPAQAHAVLQSTFSDFGNDPAITKELLAGGARSNKLAEAWLKYDEQHLGQPRQYGDHKMTFDREALSQGMKDRGYGDEAWNANYNGDPTHGKLHHADASRADVVASASNPSVIPIRGKDLTQMADSGGNGVAVLGAPADQILVAMAMEKNNTTYNNIVKHWQDSLPADQAATKTEELRQSMRYAVDNEQMHMTGMSHTGRRDFAVLRDAAATPADLAKGVLTTPTTARSGMAALWAANPGDMTRATIGMLSANPDMSKAVTSSLDDSGSDHKSGFLSFLESTPEGKLSGIIEDAVAAQRKGDVKKIARANAKLDAFINVDPSSKDGVRHRAAFDELASSIATTPGAIEALNQTTLNIIASGAKDVSPQTQQALVDTLSHTDNVLMAAKVAHTTTVIANENITSGLNPPPIPIWKGKEQKQRPQPKPPEPTPPQVTPPPPSPVTPPPPTQVTPPPPTQVTPPPPTQVTPPPPVQVTPPPPVQVTPPPPVQVTPPPPIPTKPIPVTPPPGCDGPVCSVTPPPPIHVTPPPPIQVTPPPPIQVTPPPPIQVTPPPPIQVTPPPPIQVTPPPPIHVTPPPPIQVTPPPPIQVTPPPPTQVFPPPSTGIPGTGIPGTPGYGCDDGPLCLTHTSLTVDPGTLSKSIVYSPTNAASSAGKVADATLKGGVTGGTHATVATGNQTVASVLDKGPKTLT